MSASFIGPRIKALREERNLSQDDLAHLLALNAARAADECAAGLVATGEEEDEEIEDE
jgi:transcriptional regulator with XRE-family HTH domain